ncbi:jg26026 [Pararge aegeria aegeria]|uniref:Jg26026 protein n=1 Tax=Pararge aegeria aegeria TaxID=348720 RepID=A0A8S4QNH2_9NEOP|nr:jg26026 [Pararge aegeria aegeria]
MQFSIILFSYKSPPCTLQIALRAVRERSLPDACAELLLAERDTPDDRDDEWDRRAGANSSARSDLDEDCCR